MTHWVRWTQEARDELSACFLAADFILQESIGAAAFQIDQMLRINPAEIGESRPGGRRIHFHYPLGFLFRVENDNDNVSILNVWTYKKRGH